MFKHYNNPFPLLFGPADVPTGDSLHPMSAGDILSELMSDDDGPIDLEPKKPEVKAGDKDDKDDTDNKKKSDVKDDKDEKDNDEDDDDTEDELEELERELQGPSDEQLELMTPARRKDILKEFPQLFKKFPYLETAYYRDQKFTEVFPTIKDAEAALESVKSYNELTSKLKTGDIEGVIADIKKDEKSFNKMVDNYMPTLMKVSPEAYHHIVGNLVKYTVREMFQEANNKNNDSLKNAATILHDFVFGTTKWTPPTNLSQEQSPADSKGVSDLEKREREFNERRFTTAQNDISTRVDNSIKATIEQHMDPNNHMTPFIKNAATEKALKQVEDLLGKDTRFKSLLDRLWQNAAEKDFAKPEMDKIKSACISKARTLLPSVIKAARLEALKGLGRRSKNNDEDDDSKDDTVDEPKKRDSDSPRSKSDKGSKNTVPEGMSSLDFLMQD